MNGEQEQETPVWHSIVGDDWEPVPFDELTFPDEEVLLAGGWVSAVDGGRFYYRANMRPRRRLRRRSFDVITMKDGIKFGRVKAAKPGDCFMLTNNGELIPIDKPAEGQVER